MTLQAPQQPGKPPCRPIWWDMSTMADVYTLASVAQSVSRQGFFAAQVRGKAIMMSYQASSVPKWVADKLQSAITKNLTLPSCADIPLPYLLPLDHPEAGAALPGFLRSLHAGAPPPSSLSAPCSQSATHRWWSWLTRMPGAGAADSKTSAGGPESVWGPGDRHTLA